MKQLSVFVGLLIMSSSVFAALPPYWDSVRQLETVLHSAGLDQKMHGDVISVEKVGTLQFRVRTTYCVASVSLGAKPPLMPGAVNYEVKAVEHLMCK